MANGIRAVSARETGADSRSRAQKRLLAHPPEPGYPCYVSVLGELAEMAPREEPTASLGGKTPAPKPGDRGAIAADPGPV